MKQIQLFLILKYGSMPLAYNVWSQMLPKEQDSTFTDDAHELLCEYEYEVIHDFGSEPIAKKWG